MTASPLATESHVQYAGPVKDNVNDDFHPSECLHPDCCPLDQVRVGTAVKIRQLATTPDVAERLREMGVYEDQKVRLVLKGNNLICQVCNARLGISAKLAESILVEPINAPEKKNS